jgi:hypothetical protein
MRGIEVGVLRELLIVDGIVWDGTGGFQGLIRLVIADLGLGSAQG